MRPGSRGLGGKLPDPVGVSKDPDMILLEEKQRQRQKARELKDATAVSIVDKEAYINSIDDPTKADAKAKKTLPK